MRPIQLQIGLCLAFTLWLPLSGSAAEATRPSGARARRAARTDVDRLPHWGEENEGLGFCAADPDRDTWLPDLNPALNALVPAAVSLPLPARAGTAFHVGCPAPPAVESAARRSGRAPPSHS